MFRFALGLSGEEAARLFGMRPAQLSQLETGEEGTLSRPRLEELLARLDIPAEAIDSALSALDAAFLPAPPGSPVGPTPAELRSLRRAAADSSRGTLEAVFERLTANLRQRRTSQHRGQAAELWKTLGGLPPRGRRSAIETESRYQTWAMAERLCEESVRAAAHRASDAVELSKLALRAAELAPVDEPWRSRLLGWVWAFAANARRVQGDLPGAEEGFRRSDRFLEVGAAADPRPLDATRPLDLKASLRRYQGRFDEALDLLDQALKANGSKEARGRILINKANTLELMGNPEVALAELLQAELLLAGGMNKRSAWIIQHSLAHTLWRLGRYREAEERLPEARKRAIEMGNELDLIRTLWVEGGIAAGLEDNEKALITLEQVRRYFNANRIAYDAALVSLELAVIYLDWGRSAEVKKLSEELYWIFKSQGVHQEALAALRLFFEAARKEEATAELARQLLEYLIKARCHPGLRFEAH